MFEENSCPKCRSKLVGVDILDNIILICCKNEKCDFVWKSKSSEIIYSGSTVSAISNSKILVE